MSTFFNSKDDKESDSFEDKREPATLEELKDCIRANETGELLTAYKGVLIQYNFYSGMVFIPKEKVGSVEMSFEEKPFQFILVQVRDVIGLVAKEKLLLWLYQQGDKVICDMIVKNHDIDANNRIVNKSSKTAEDTLKLIFDELKPRFFSVFYSRNQNQNHTQQTIYKILDEYGIKNINNGNDVNIVISRISASIPEIKPAAKKVDFD